MKNFVIALTTMLGLVLLPASPAAASGYYCGHTSTTHWWDWNPHTVRFVNSWNDYGDPNRHQHQVKTSYVVGFVSLYSSHSCN